MITITDMVCPICGQRWYSSSCKHTKEDLRNNVITARRWAGIMYRRAQKAERELAELKAKTEETVERQ